MPAFDNTSFMERFNPSLSAMGVCGYIDVYFTGLNYLSKVCVSSTISNTSEFTFAGPQNINITISDLIPSFSFPLSVVSFGKDLNNATSQKFRMISMFNQNAFRIDFELDENRIVITNATPSNLGCLAQSGNFPSEETLVAKIFITYIQL